MRFRSGADPNFVDAEGYTPLIYATCRVNREKVLAWLVWPEFPFVTFDPTFRARLGRCKSFYTVEHVRVLGGHALTLEPSFCSRCNNQSSHVMR